MNRRALAVLSKGNDPGAPHHVPQAPRIDVIAGMGSAFRRAAFALTTRRARLRVFQIALSDPSINRGQIQSGFDAHRRYNLNSQSPAYGKASAVTDVAAAAARSGTDRYVIVFTNRG